MVGGDQQVLEALYHQLEKNRRDMAAFLHASSSSAGARPLLARGASLLRLPRAMSVALASCLVLPRALSASCLVCLVPLHPHRASRKGVQP